MISKEKKLNQIKLPNPDRHFLFLNAHTNVFIKMIIKRFFFYVIDYFAYIYIMSFEITWRVVFEYASRHLLVFLLIKKPQLALSVFLELLFPEYFNEIM